MSPIRFAALALLTILCACSDRASPSSPTDLPPGPPGSVAPSGTAPRNDRPAMERLARRTALALADPRFRAYVKAELDRSPVREHKLHFQRFLGRADHVALRALARASGEAEASLDDEARRTIPLEMYLPVPAHRTAWAGGDDILVATEQADHDAPVAFDVHGNRRVLSPDRPPATPVLAIEPVETDFDRSDGFLCCAGGGPVAPPGLYMKASPLVQDFEGGWKGSSEYEIHILGQSGSSDSLTSYQCAGEHAGGYYSFDQNDLNWSGSVLLFTQAQLDGYKSQHPGQNYRVLALEDDDGACQIRLDGNRFKSFQNALQTQYPNLTGGKDSVSSGLVKLFKKANALQKILRAAYSWITSQDDLIGNAIEDVVVGEFHTGFNWVIRGENNVTNGWIKLEMR
jgi:hypothetical protein